MSSSSSSDHGKSRGGRLRRWVRKLGSVFVLFAYPESVAWFFINDVIDGFGGGISK